MKTVFNFKTRTFWVGVATMAFGGFVIVTKDVTQGVGLVLLGAGMVTGRAAIEDINKKGKS